MVFANSWLNNFMPINVENFNEMFNSFKMQLKHTQKEAKKSNNPVIFKVILSEVKTL
jgi:hypothetical protein